MPGRSRPRRALPNAVIAVFLALQIAATFKLPCPPKAIPALEPLRVACSPELWPFLEYNMYNGARQAGETHHAYDLIAELRDGSEEVLTADRVGLSHYDLRGRAIKGLLQGAVLRTTLMLGSFLELNPDIVALRLEAQPYVLESDGTITSRPRTLVTRRRVQSGQVIR